MDLCNESCSSGRLAVLRGKNFNVGHYTQTFKPFFIPAMLIGTTDFYKFFITFTDLKRGWESQGQCKAKPLGYIFSHTFELIRMKFEVLKQLKLNIPKLCLSGI